MAVGVSVAVAVAVAVAVGVAVEVAVAVAVVVGVVVAVAVYVAVAVAVGAEPPGKQTACGGVCLRQATSGARTGRAAPINSAMLFRGRHPDVAGGIDCHGVRVVEVGAAGSEVAGKVAP